VFGIESDHDEKGGRERGKNTLYLLELEDLALVHLGDLGRKLNTEEIEELNHVDILMIPTGGTYTINPEQAAEVVTQLEPYIVIPMHYHPPVADHLPEADSELSKELAPVEKFLEQMGAEGTKPQKSLKVKKRSLPEETEVTVLERNK
jgi:L-ascorbate metabolism protein UlaG (beta-lactamase superfamily)